MSIPTLDVSAFGEPEHILVAASRATIKEWGIVTRIHVRVDRSDGEWQEYTIGDKTHEMPGETA